MSKRRLYESDIKAEIYERKYSEIFSATSSRVTPIPFEEEMEMEASTQTGIELLTQYENDQIDIKQLNQQKNVDPIPNEISKTKQILSQKNQSKSLRK